MDRIAFVFPGQGSQSAGMGKALVEASPAAAAVMAEADRALGEPISRLAFEGPAEELDLTVNAQPALVATSIAFLAALRERWAAAGVAEPTPLYCAGHSMGQYSALVAAGSISLADAVRLVRERGRQMQASGKGRSGAMAAIIGLDDARIPELLAAGKPHGSVTVANRNAPGQVVDLRRSRGRRGGRGRRQGPRRPARHPAAGVGGRPLVADGRRGPGHGLRPGAYRLRRPRDPAPGQRRRPAHRHRRPRPATS